MNHEDGSPQFAGEACGEAYHSLDTSGGESNHHYITTRHGVPSGNEYQNRAIGPV
jgi:hypothetical protein